jgi:hypothetical protein
MKKHLSIRLTTKRFLIACCLALTSMEGMTANHALIMTIGTYANPDANLPGIDIDAQNAAQIAKALGTPEANIQIVTDKKLTLQGISQLLSDLKNRVSKGDGVFIYYSGHGTQMNAGSGKCSEAMLTHDMKVYKDVDLQNSLIELSQKANRVIMMNDSCFSGGQAQVKSRGAVRLKAKAFKLSEAQGSYACGEAINMKISRSVAPRAKTLGSNFLYIAASQDNEVAHASSQGSFATLAWKQCLSQKSDANHSGALSGEEIKICSQRFIDSKKINQHVSLIGNKDLPLVFVSDETEPTVSDAPSVDNAADPTPDLTQDPPLAGETESVSPEANVTEFSAANALNDIRNAASPSVIVRLKPENNKVKIGRDALNLSVESNKKGFLTILQVGSDGKTFNQIFPNDVDQDNAISAGVTLLPRPNWQVKAGGPAGNSYLLAIVSDTKDKSFSKGMKKAGPFRTARGIKAAKNLYVEAVNQGNNDSPSTYGASEVIKIEEY